MAATAEAPARRCPQGHLIEGYNAARIKHTSGRMYTACRQCRNDAVKRVKARQRGEDVPLMAPTPVPKPARSFATVELWTALPVPLRAHVAGILMDRQPPDPLVASVIRRVAQRRVWERIGVHFATIALCEGLIEESRAATSSRLRIDRVLAVALG
jgi:hypothetical protein